jgi:hypothetical protein
MGLKTAIQHNAAIDSNKVPSLTATSGTPGTADTTGTAEIVRVGADPVTGALYVYDINAQAAGGGTQFAEDAIHSSGAGGNIALVVRNDAGGALAADGDYNVLQVDGDGNLRISGTVATGAGTQAVRIIDGTVTSNTSVANLVKGTITKVEGGTLGEVTLVPTVTTVSNVTNGSVRVTVGTINVGTFVQPSGTITTGSLMDLTNLYSGSVRMTVGTLTTGSLTNLASLHTGTIQSVSEVVKGTVTLVPTVTTVSNLTNGSINILTGTTTLVSTVTTVSNLTNGSVNILSGTVNNAGTVKDLYATVGTFTITVGTLASNGSVGRQSTLLDNTTNLYSSALIGVQITPGTVTAAGVINFFLIRSDNGAPIADDNAGANDAAWTQVNAPLLGVVNVPIGTNNQFKVTFDTGAYRLGPKWGIGVVHALGNPLNATAGSHSITYVGVQSKIA